MSFDPNDIYAKPIGSTILPSQIDTQKVVTKEIDLGEKGTLTGISQKYTENKYDTSPSSYALWQGLNRLQQNINAIDPESNFFRDDSVVSLPLIDPHFSITDPIPWQIKGWSIIDAKAFYQGVGNNDNYLRIPQEVFTFPSYYHLNINIKRIDSGKLVLYDNLEQVVLEMDKAQEYDIEMYIANPDVTTLRVVATDVYPDDVVEIESINLHLVTDRFRDYFVAMMKDGNLVVGIDAPQAIRITNEIVNNAVNALTIFITSVRDELVNHKADNNNPHGVTYQQIHAASADHVHAEIGNLSGDMTVALAHAAIKNGNPHGTTATDVGAANIQHTHTPEECSASPVTHNHDDRYLKTDALDNLKEVIDEQIKENKEERSESGSFIVKVPEQGEVAPGADNTPMTPPAGLIVFPYNPHSSTWDYDYYFGEAQCNIDCYGESYAGLAFSDFYGKSADFNKVPFPNDPVILKYKFTTKRKIRGYKLYKSQDPNISGFASNWILEVDGIQIEEAGDSTWADFTPDKTRCYLSEFENEIEVSEVTLTIKGAITEDDIWGIRISFLFADTKGDSLLSIGTLKKGLFLNYPDHANEFVPEDIEVDMQELAPTVDAPAWSFIKRKEIDNKITHSVDIDFVYPEYSPKRAGVPALMDRFKSNINGIFGSISTNSEDPDYPVRNVFSYENDISKNNYFKSLSASGISIDYDSTVEYRLPNVTRIGFKWYHALYEFVPKSLRIMIDGTFTQDGESLIGSQEVLAISDLLIPVRRKNLPWIYLEFTNEKMRGFTDIKQISVEFNYNGEVRNEQACIALSELSIFTSAWWASRATMESNDDSRLPIGRIESLPVPDTSLFPVMYQHSGFPIDKIMGVPVNNFDYLLEGIYTVPNPFISTDIDIEVFTNLIQNTTDDSTAVYGIKACEVYKITPVEIKVKVNYPGRYGLKVIRQW